MKFLQAIYILGLVQVPRKADHFRAGRVARFGPRGPNPWLRRMQRSTTWLQAMDTRTAGPPCSAATGGGTIVAYGWRKPMERIPPYRREETVISE